MYESPRVFKGESEIPMSMNTLSNQKIGSIPRRQYSARQRIRCQPEDRQTKTPLSVPAPLMIECRRMMLARLAPRSGENNTEAARSKKAPVDSTGTQETRQVRGARGVLRGFQVYASRQVSMQNTPTTMPRIGKKRPAVISDTTGNQHNLASSS